MVQVRVMAVISITATPETRCNAAYSMTGSYMPMLDRFHIKHKAVLFEK